MGDGRADTLDGHAGVAVYRVDHTSGEISGRFVLPVYEGEVVPEVGTRVRGSGPDGSVEGVYDITTHAPEGGVFATGTLEFRPIGDDGAYAVVWVLNVTKDFQKQLGLPPTMIYDASGLAVGDDGIAVGWDNADYRTLRPRVRRFR